MISRLFFFPIFFRAPKPEFPFLALVFSLAATVFASSLHNTVVTFHRTSSLFVNRNSKPWAPLRRVARRLLPRRCASDPRVPRARARRHRARSTLNFETSLSFRFRDHDRTSPLTRSLVSAPPPGRRRGGGPRRGGGGGRGSQAGDQARDGSFRSAFPAAEPGEALLHALQRVPQVQGAAGRGRGGVRDVREVLPLSVPDRVG